MFLQIVLLRQRMNELFVILSEAKNLKVFISENSCYSEFKISHCVRNDKQINFLQGKSMNLLKIIARYINTFIAFIAGIMGIGGVTIGSLWSKEVGIVIGILAGILLIVWWVFIKPPKISYPPTIKDLHDYFAKIDRNFAEWKKLFVIDKINNDFISIYAEEVNWYVSLQLVEQKKLREGFVMELREKLIADGEWQMVLTGQAGIGKTTSLRYLQYQDRQNYQPQKPIPVYLDLGYAEEGQSIKAWIVKELQVGRLALGVIKSVVNQYQARKSHATLDKNSQCQVAIDYKN